MSDAVLIVDDSLTVRMDLADAFEQAGFSPRQCSTIGEARASLEKERFALVILDILLPDGDGVDLLHEIRAQRLSDAPVLLMSTEAEVRDRIRGLRVGADDYIGKPYDVKYVIARASELVRGKSSAGRERALVLVIDDSPTFRDVLRNALESAGYAVIVAASGEEGLRVAGVARPTAVLVDSVMTGIDGATVIRRMRLDAALRGTPCVMLTASEADGAELRALDAGADAFVRKEEAIEVILARLAAVLRSAVADRSQNETLLGPKRILAVDDSATYLSELGDMLRGEGYDVVLARSGEEAIEMLGMQSFDCILLDLQMPDMDGTETCRRIKASPTVRDIPLIMLTALEERSAMIDGLASGADDFISKSSDFEVLKARVRAQLRRKQFEDEHRRVRDDLLRSELMIAEERAARTIAEVRATMVEELERKREEAERERARAETANQAKTLFLANMSHELRTPLNAIIGFSEVLAIDGAKTLTPVEKEYVGYILQSGRHLLMLINDILDLSTVEAGRLDLQCEPTSVANIVDLVRVLVMPIAEKRRVKVSTSIEPGLPAIEADPLRLRQVLYNLISNAIKFTPDRGDVTLEAKRAGASVEIAVHDTGVGIREEDRSRLFREFEQLDSTRGMATEGTGLGLALTKKLVELHGGAIRVESTFGRGSTFTVSLPISPSSRSATDRGGESTASSHLRGSILVVENDRASRILVRDILAPRGHRVLEAANVEEARRIWATESVDLVLTDLGIPGGGGQELLDQARKHATASSRKIPVIATTASLMQGEEKRVLASGFDGYIGKPIETRQLGPTLESFLRR